MHGQHTVRVSAQGRGPVRVGVSQDGKVRGRVDKSWLDELPEFCDTTLVARIFGVSTASSRAWMSGEDSILPGARRPDGRYVTARAHVIALAQKLYGEMGS